MTVSVELEKLSKHFEEVRAVDAVSLTIEAGRLYVLLGPSGCGKSTTLRLVAGLEAPNGGLIRIGGENMTEVPPYRRDLGLVFQNYALFPHMSVAANVAFGLKMRGADRAETGARVREALALVHLEGYEDRRPSQLSGGQQQRVALARALVIRPRALLLDEPLSNLDKNLRDEMRGQVRELQRGLAITTIMVTHDQEEALAIGDRIVVMRDGRIEQTGTGEEVYRKPATRFVATFLGAANIFEGRLADGGYLEVPGGLRLPVATSGRAGTPAALVIRPADARLAVTQMPSDPAPLAGTVVGSVYQGSLRRHVIELPSGRSFHLDTPDHGEPPPPLGAQVRMRYDPRQCHVLLGAPDRA